MDDKKKVNLRISYNIKLSQLDWIYYMTNYVTDHVIIQFYDITILAYLYKYY